MNIGKNKIKQIQEISLVDEMLREFGYNFMGTPPDSWHNEENVELYDRLNIFETRLKNAILDIINGKGK